jgi:MEMO1 family protein
MYSYSNSSGRLRHAGFDYSGPCAAWAYSALDLSKAKRVFLLGPSHTYYLDGCAVTTFAKYATPFGDLVVDQATVQEVKEAGSFDDIPARQDAAEHSLEMHTPYIYKRFQQTFGSPDKFPPIVPILIGDNDRHEEKEVGRILAPYLKDPENAFIISSDFCHWGAHFSYMVYSPESDPSKLISLKKTGSAPAGPPIHETIRLIDEAAMDAVAGGSHDAFIDNLKLTGNTVCGRHPIGVAMAALEHVSREAGHEQSKFKIIRYERSSLVESPRDSSVSYVSAYAVL